MYGGLQSAYINTLIEEGFWKEKVRMNNNLSVEIVDCLKNAHNRVTEYKNKLETTEKKIHDEIRKRQ